MSGSLMLAMAFGVRALMRSKGFTGANSDAYKVLVEAIIESEAIVEASADTRIGELESQMREMDAELDLLKHEVFGG